MAGPSGPPPGGAPTGIQQQIFETLQRQTHPQGWQTGVSIRERGGHVFQL